MYTLWIVILRQSIHVDIIVFVVDLETEDKDTNQECNKQWW